jgi:prepilin-type N-terminal cleavage/methylation domain-containing protein
MKTKTIMMKTIGNQKGFTLAELLIATAMIGFVMAGTFVALQQGENAFQYSTGRVEVQQTARMAVDRMAHDLRTGSTVTVSNASSVTFQYIDDTGATVTVQYSLTGTNLQRNQTNPVPAAAQPETLIGGVNALVLIYYDNNNVTTTTAANVRVVKIRVTTQPQDTSLASYNLANQRAVFEDRVRLRNL